MKMEFAIMKYTQLSLLKKRCRQFASVGKVNICRDRRRRRALREKERERERERERNGEGAKCLWLGSVTTHITAVFYSPTLYYSCSATLRHTHTTHTHTHTHALPHH